MEPLLANKKDCTGCLACLDSCSFGALKDYVGDDGHIYVACDSSKCVACGKCTKVCPVVSSFEYGSNANVISQPYSAWAKNDNLRMKSASGGAFAAIATYILSNGGYVVGASMQGLIVKHIMINTVNDLHLLQGSKYLQSNTCGVYRDTLVKLKQGNTVFFSGTPCQVAGVLCYVANTKYSGNLYTADIICGGIPSNLLVNTLISYDNRIDSIVSFRDKSEGWKSFGYKYSLIVSKQKKIENLKSQNILISGFCSGLTNRYSCSDCQFSGALRKSDITLADYWGVKEFLQEHFKGVSLLVCHSATGKDLLDKSEIVINKTTWVKSITYNPRMVFGRRILSKYRIERRFLSLIFKKCSYKTLNKIYAGRITKRDFLWLPYKAYKYVIWKLNAVVTKKNVADIINRIE